MKNWEFLSSDVMQKYRYNKRYTKVGGNGMRFRHVSVQNKLIVLILVFICIPFLIAAVFWYNQSAITIQENSVRFSQQGMEQINDRLDSYFLELDSLTLPILTNSTVHEFLDLDSSHPYDYYQIGKNIEEDLFFEIFSVKKEMYNLSIVSSDGHVYSTHQRESALQAYREIKDINRKHDYFNILGVRQVGNNPVLTITRNIVDPLTYENKGMLIIDIHYGYISDMLENSKLTAEDQIWVIDPKGKFIYHEDQTMLGKRVGDAYPEFSLQKGNGYYIESSSAGGKLVIYNHLSSTGWLVVDTIPIVALNGNLTKFLNLTVVMAVLLIVMALVIIGGFTFTLIRPLLHLQRLMKRAELGDLKVRAPEHKAKEIGSLYRSFNTMVSEINRLIQEVHMVRLKEKELKIKHMESVLMAMQSQINPHFLYNTLEVVNSYAIEAGVKPVSRMVRYISKMFRYNVENLQSTVTLYDEMDHIETYLKIQIERYKGLKVETELDEKTIQDILCLRLVLQPIVENVFIHAYEKHEIKPDFLRIEGQLEEEMFLVKIIDHGGGMPEHIRKKLNQKFSSVSVEEMVQQKQEQEQGIGMWNVHSRLRLHFGEPYGLFIHRSDANGTEIHIKLPKE